MKVTGLEKLSLEKNYIIVSNYPGSYAGFALMHVFPETLMLVHAFLSKVPIIGYLLKSTGGVFVQRKQFRKTKQVLDETLKNIESKSIIIFPEGGRTADGRIRKFKHGFIYLLRHSSMDLVPVSLRGFYRLKPLKRFYLDPDSDLEVVIHNPISRFTIESLKDEELLKLTFNIIEEAYRP